MEKVFRLSYERYKRSSSRPSGMGPFFDFAAAVARRQRRRPKSSQAAPAPVAHADDSESRWDGEGGNTQTRVARGTSAG